MYHVVLGRPVYKVHKSSGELVTFDIHFDIDIIRMSKGVKVNGLSLYSLLPLFLCKNMIIELPKLSMYCIMNSVSIYRSKLKSYSLARFLKSRVVLNNKYLAIF